MDKVKQELILEQLMEETKMISISRYVDAISENKIAYELYNSAVELKHNKRSVLAEMLTDEIGKPYLLINKSTKLGATYLELGSVELTDEVIIKKELKGLTPLMNRGLVLVNPRSIRRGAEYIREENKAAIEKILNKYNYKYAWVDIKGDPFKERRRTDYDESNGY